MHKKKGLRRGIYIRLGRQTREEELYQYGPFNHHMMDIGSPWLTNGGECVVEDRELSTRGRGQL